MISREEIIMEKSNIVKVSWSGGKDSTADIILETFDNNKCKIVSFIPMLSADIPLIRKAHYEHIMKCADKFEQWGHKVYFVTGRTYVEHFLRTKTRGKYKGTIAGYDLGIGYCKFRECSKIPSLKNLDVGYYDYESIGIAYDEIRRQNQLNEKLRSTLVEHKFTEQMAYNLCKSWGVLSPQYELTGRDGCCICPNAKDIEYLEYLKEYPEAKYVLLKLDYIYNSTENIKPDKPFRGYENFTDRMKRLGIL